MTDILIDADLVDKYPHDAGVEITRLRAINADLLETLEKLFNETIDTKSNITLQTAGLVRAAIARAKNQP